MAMVQDGLSWTWFMGRTASLSTWAVWPHWRKHRPTPVLEGEAIEQYWANR